MKRILLIFGVFFLSVTLLAQEPVQLGAASYASFAPYAESWTTEHWGCQAYQTDNRHLYIEDSLATRPVPTNDWWTYALVNQWTGNLWAYPAVVRAEATGIQISYPDNWSDDGCEMHWSTTLNITGQNFHPTEALIADWSDYSISFVLKDGTKQIKTTLMQGSPLVWLEFKNLTPKYDNPDESKYAVFEHINGQKTYISVGLVNETLTRADIEPYAFRIPLKTSVIYRYDAAASALTTRFHVYVKDILGTHQTTVLHGFIPHHYRNTTMAFSADKGEYGTPRGKMKIAAGNDFDITYTVHGFLPFFPAPQSDLAGYDEDRMKQLAAEYAAKGTFGGDTYWGGKGLTQMAHYMTFAYQMGDMQTFEQAKQRLKEVLINWYTYTPGEENFYFARYPRFGAMVGFDTSYDSDTFNDHHFHYGYYTYASALLCLFDDDFRRDYGQMAREVALDYACWEKDSDRYPWFRTFSPWYGHSFAGGMGNEGNGNGQESTSEAMQGWGGVWLLGAALGDKEMMEAGIFGYTIEARGTAEYWFDRSRQNIDYTRYQHPYCCNLTSQGVGWWTWFSGDPVWMHSIQWLPISPILINYLSEDLDFTRWDYTEMYGKKEVGNYEAATGGLGDESGLGNVCLSYLSLFEPDSAANIFDRMWNSGKALAKNPDTGGITYWLTHAHRSLGDKCYDVLADYPLACAYKKAGQYTFAVYNADNAERTVRFTLPDKSVKTFTAAARRLTMFTDEAHLNSLRLDAPAVIEPNSMVSMTLHFLDQYGATYRQDSLVQYTAPAQTGDKSFTVTYQGLSAQAEFRIGALPVLTAAQIVPELTYLTVGQQVLFTLEATDQYGNTYPTSWSQTYTASTPKQETITATVEGKTYTTDFTVLPAYPNIALKKTATCSSSENTQAMPASAAVDGDMGSRWGSQHKDGEWLQVDLGSVCYIDHITIHWEAAYAAQYLIQVIGTQQDTTSYTVSCTGGEVTTAIGGNGRYVRILGISRATQYGISIYELEVYGIDNTQSATDLFGLVISSDKEVVEESEDISFSVKGYNRLGQEMTISPVLSVTTGNATLQGNSTLHTTAAGKVTLTATAGGVVASRSWQVTERVQTDSIAIYPKEVTLAQGESITFRVVTYNQFGVETERTEIPYQATAAGNHTVTGELSGLSTTATVNVVSFSEMNLALGKTATASSIEGWANTAAMAVDGSQDTRWSSSFNDNQWLEIDLEHIYYVNLIRLYWEASYATSYTISVSADGITYTQIYANNNSQGGKQEIPISETEIRYIRIACLTRVNQYGFSLFEVEVYGTGKKQEQEEPELPAVPDDEVEPDYSYEWVVTHLQQLSAIAPNMNISVYSIAGQTLYNGTALQATATIKNLRTGIYLLRTPSRTLKFRVE